MVPSVGARNRRGSSDRVRAADVPRARGAPRAAAAGLRVRAGVVHAARAACAAALRAAAGRPRHRYPPSCAILCHTVREMKACVCELAWFMSAVC